MPELREKDREEERKDHSLRFRAGELERVTRRIPRDRMMTNQRRCGSRA
jgi:hypothetical protein